MENSALGRETLCCSICLDPLQVPVTIPCGHNYCMGCINKHWDEEDKKNIHSCPQCRQTFTLRPNLVKNTMLAELVEEMKETRLQAALPDRCYARAGDVACDFCAGRKLKAVKSCLQCLVSFCEQHIQPHFNTPALKVPYKHQLVNPSEKLQENFCSQHGEVMRIFCRTDQQCICYLCSLNEHKGHDTVSAAAERTDKQKQLEPNRQKITLYIQDKEKEVGMLLQEIQAIDLSADKAVRDNEKIFAELIHLIEKKSSDMKQRIKNQQKTEVRRVKELLQKLDQEITELKREEADLQQLSQTEDHIQFLQLLPFLSEPPESAKSFLPKQRTLQYFDDVTKTVSGVKEKLQSILGDEWPRVLLSLTEVDVLLPQPEPTSRDEFLQHAQHITLDPNTVNTKLLLSEGDRRATYQRKKQTYPNHAERFMNRSQVLSREALTGRHYWEVEWSGVGAYIGVAYKDISRVGDESEFGNNDQSWVLSCLYAIYEFIHDGYSISLSGPQDSRVGVYLDHKAGILSFYSVSDTMTLLHRVQTTFTRPLHAGFRTDHFLGFGSSVVLNELE